MAKTKRLEVIGHKCIEGVLFFNIPLNCVITEEETGKKLSINDGYTQFTIPIEAIKEHIKD